MAEPFQIETGIANKIIGSDSELFVYLTQCIRFGSWKDWRLNQAENATLILGGGGRPDKQLSKSLACPGLANCMLVSVNDFNLEDNLPIGPWCMPSMSLYLGTVEILRHDSYLLLKFQVYQTLLEAMMKPQK